MQKKILFCLEEKNECFTNNFLPSNIKIRLTYWKAYARFLTAGSAAGSVRQTHLCWGPHGTHGLNQ